jgi:hypothetical protein
VRRFLWPTQIFQSVAVFLASGPCYRGDLQRLPGCAQEEYKMTEFDDSYAISTADGDSDLLPVLPLRDVVVYPHMVIPLFVGRERSIRALDAAMGVDKQIVLIAQRSAEIDEPKADDL